MHAVPLSSLRWSFFVSENTLRKWRAVPCDSDFPCHYCTKRRSLLAYKQVRDAIFLHYKGHYIVPRSVSRSIAIRLKPYVNSVSNPWLVFPYSFLPVCG